MHGVQFDRPSLQDKAYLKTYLHDFCISITKYYSGSMYMHATVLLLSWLLWTSAVIIDAKIYNGKV